MGAEKKVADREVSNRVCFTIQLLHHRIVALLGHGVGLFHFSRGGLGEAESLYAASQVFGAAAMIVA